MHAADSVQGIRSGAVAAYRRGDEAEAISGFRRAICAAGRPPQRDRQLAASLKVELSVVCSSFGHSSIARRLAGEAVRALSAAPGGERDLARAWNTLGNLDSGDARHADAAAAFAEAVRLMQAHGSRDPGDLPLALRNLGIAQSALDLPHKAVRSFRQALACSAAPAERRAAQFSLANAYCSTSQYSCASALYEELLRGTEGAEWARIACSLAILRERTGELGAASALYRQAAAMRRPGVDRESLVRVLANAADFHASLGDHDDADRLIRTARRWTRGSPVADVLLLSASAGLALARGDARGALRRFEQAAVLAAASSGPGSSTVLALQRSAADLRWTADPAAAHAGLAAALDACAAAPGDPQPAVARATLGMMALELGRFDEAHAHARASFLDEVAMGAAELRWRVLLLLARLQWTNGCGNAAILLGKLAITALCRLGAESTAANGSGAAYRRQRSPAFQEVSNWLAATGRLPEAIQVHRAGLTDELFDLFRRVEENCPASPPIALTGAEEALCQQFEVAVAPFGSDAGSAGLGAPERARQLTAWLEEVSGETWAKPGQAAAAVIAEMPVPPVGTALLRYVQHPRGYRLAIQVENRLHQVDVEAPASEIGRCCLELHARLMDRDPAVHATAARLHALLVAPAMPWLAGVQELCIVPDGVLRYVPFAALHDGERFLVERWAVSSATAANPRHGRRAPRRDWGAVGFGGGGLAHVRRELETSVGRLGGRVLLGAAFTRDALVEALRAEAALVHVASHFTVQQARAGRSRLALGDGTVMALDEFRAPGVNLSQVELMVLSACDTGLDVADEQGLCSLAGVLQQLGARSVLATLWPVNDEAAANLISAFYEAAFASSDPPSLAEALRIAQLQLIASPGRDGQCRGGLGISASRPALAHPFFWAGYTLFGDPA